LTCFNAAALALPKGFYNTDLRTTNETGSQSIAQLRDSLKQKMEGGGGGVNGYQGRFKKLSFFVVDSLGQMV
jgi:hypothetical protein